jgi:hypothetical protein
VSGYDWRDQLFRWGGKSRALGEVSGGRWYHGSRTPIPVGGVVEPGHGRNFAQSPDGMISVTSIEGNARRWAYAAAGRRDLPVYVYEVEPLAEIEPHRVAPADHGTSFQFYEGRTTTARVLREVQS